MPYHLGTPPFTTSMSSPTWKLSKSFGQRFYGVFITQTQLTKSVAVGDWLSLGFCQFPILLGGPVSINPLITQLVPLATSTSSPYLQELIITKDIPVILSHRKLPRFSYLVSAHRVGKIKYQLPVMSFWFLQSKNKMCKKKLLTQKTDDT